MFYQRARLRRQDGHWYGVLSYKDGGRWRERSKRLSAPTSKAAQRELDQWRLEMESKAGVAGSATPVVDYMLSIVDGLASRAVIERSTVTHYRKDARAWLPWLDGVRLSDLRRPMVEDAMADMLSRGTAPTTVNRRFTMLRMACEEAVSRGDLASSPVSGVRRPRLRRPTVNYCDRETRSLVISKLSSMPTSRYVVAFQLALRAGLRRGEVCGLRVGDVDLASRTLWVRRSIGIDGSTPYVKPTKAGRARDVPLSDELAVILAEWLAGGRGAPTDWLLGGEDGRFMNPDVLSHRWASLAEAEGWLGSAGRRPTLHDLRHTFATVAVASGADVKSVSSILGHASASMTLDVYASADKRAKRDAAALIGARM